MTSTTNTTTAASPPPTTMTATTASTSVLNARELEWAVNSPALLAEHHKINGPIVRTRFPPEPNGYLHIGHAKSMNMNFRLAFDKLQVPMEHRRCIFRYDDTNPDTETVEYIDSLQRDVSWLGWIPERTTYSSDYFTELHALAVRLIELGLAYVCDMTSSEMEAQREYALKRVMLQQQLNNNRSSNGDTAATAAAASTAAENTPPHPLWPGRNRNTSVQRNLRLFEHMRLGLFEEGQYTLRLKMDLDSPNPNMWDLVAYRIKYTAHPHCTNTGTKWCIYPTYDFTHGICDSLEHVDYSICTLEFETRREPYFWILWALTLYRPKVYEMSRLNLQYVVLSKRRLIKLVDRQYVRGWNDPRMPTISGLRRRGYTAAILNAFCMEVGATRKANVVEMSKLQQTARTQLAESCRRCMAVLDPIRVVITNFDEVVTLQKEQQQQHQQPLTFDVQNIANDPSKGSHTITFTPTLYIDASDFRLEDSPNYYGLAPNKPMGVGLKYQGGSLVCDQVIFQDDNSENKNRSPIIKELICHVNLSPDRCKPKTHISWVPSDSLPCEVRLYDHLFLVPEPSDLWEDELNPRSEIVHVHALVDPSVANDVYSGDDIAEQGRAHSIDPWTSGVGFQFERFGYFVVDNIDTTFDPRTRTGSLVFNQTVSLKEEVLKKQLTAEEASALETRRKAAAQNLADKERRMQLDPINLFRLGDEYSGKFSAFQEDTGIPTHYMDGTEVTKSMMKKLVKEQQKHAKQVTARNQQN